MILNNKEGITLVEIIIVLVIITILASISFVGPQFLRNERITRASRELLGDLQRARQDAITRVTPAIAATSRGFGIRFASPTSYTIFEFSDTDNDFRYDGAGEEANTTSRNLTSSIVIKRCTTGASLVDPSGSNDDILIYDKLGIPKDPGGTLGNMTFVIKHNTESASEKCIKVSVNRIREGVWNASASGGCSEKCEEQ